MKFKASYLSDWLAAGAGLLIGAVDNHLARGEMAEAVEMNRGKVWWLDCGNANHNGQVLIGNLGRKAAEFIKVDQLGLINGLPAPHVQAPDLLPLRVILTTNLLFPAQS